MAGFPVRNKLLADIKASGGFEAVLERIADGETMKSIAASFKVSPTFLRGRMKAAGLEEQIITARKESGVAHAEMALEIAHNAEPETERVSRLQYDAHKWIASKHDPEGFGETKAPLLNITVGSLHLDALRHLEVVAQQTALLIAPPPPDPSENPDDILDGDTE